jgi:hypothetical protein
MRTAVYGNVKNATIIVQPVIVQKKPVVYPVKEISIYMIENVLTHA